MHVRGPAKVNLPRTAPDATPELLQPFVQHCTYVEDSSCVAPVELLEVILELKLAKVDIRYLKLEVMRRSVSNEVQSTSMPGCRPEE